MISFYYIQNVIKHYSRMPDDLDYTITNLNLSNKGFVELPDDIDKYTNLKKLKCIRNQITSLDNLPPTLIKLDCGFNKITSLDNLPSTLEELECSFNQIISLDNLPQNLKKLYCSFNQITSVDNLPPTLE